jgi:hypothetical protein
MSMNTWLERSNTCATLFPSGAVLCWFSVYSSKWISCRKCVLYFTRKQTQLWQLLEDEIEYQHVFYVTRALQSVRRGKKSAWIEIVERRWCRYVVSMFISGKIKGLSRWYTSMRLGNEPLDNIFRRFNTAIVKDSNSTHIYARARARTHTPHKHNTQHTTHHTTTHHIKHNTRHIQVVLVKILVTDLPTVLPGFQVHVSSQNSLCNHDLPYPGCMPKLPKCSSLHNTR